MLEQHLLMLRQCFLFFHNRFEQDIGANHIFGPRSGSYRTSLVEGPQPASALDGRFGDGLGKDEDGSGTRFDRGDDGTVVPAVGTVVMVSFAQRFVEFGVTSMKIIVQINEDGQSRYHLGGCGVLMRGIPMQIRRGSIILFVVVFIVLVHRIIIIIEGDTSRRKSGIDVRCEPLMFVGGVAINSKSSIDSPQCKGLLLLPRSISIILRFISVLGRRRRQ
mmetsp:Transcript_9243/g.19971  ORF Transcript_9243/g.19971 Transcript_9243/m.19971 type:complete len:219 (+) Transcript_9243:90-746(+)